jgi:tripartite-type tricarboxylate transporter receptor subunit TctC
MHNASSRIASHLYFQKTGLQVTEAGYKTSIDALNDVAAGLIDFVFVDVTLGVGQARQGRVRALAVTPRTRATFAPELPTMQEAGVPNFDYSVVWSAWMPKGTPAEPLRVMHGLLNKVVALEETRRFLLEAGSDPLPSGSPEASRVVMEREVRKWREIVDLAGITKQ